MNLKLLALALTLLGGAAHAQTTVFQEDFESGYANWAMTGLWHGQDAADLCSSGQVPFPSGTHCVWFGASGTPYGCSFSTTATSIQYMTCTQPIVLPTTTGTIELSYQSWSNVENSSEWDMHGVQVREVGTTSWSELLLSFNSWFWRLDTRDLTRWAGKTIELRFFMNPVDFWGNETIGVFVDDVRITDTPDVTRVYTTCAADGTWSEHCPCSNVSTAGRGCASSFSSSGAGLIASGSLRVSNDTLGVHVDGLSASVATLFQATGRSYFTSSPIAGDGVSCITGPYVRLVSRYAPDGVLDYPLPGDASISTLGFVQPGQTRYYSVRYRDTGTFCTAATFNVTNTVSAFWRP